MSRELPYFPPPGTKYPWVNKTLNYSAWTCNLSTQMEPSLYLYPMNVQLWVDFNEQWCWILEVTDFTHNRMTKKGVAIDGLAACLAAEELGEAEVVKLLPDWVRTALKNKWRPPA
jgi:hypothetical protein